MVKVNPGEDKNVAKFPGSHCGLADKLLDESHLKKVVSPSLNRLQKKRAASDAMAGGIFTVSDDIKDPLLYNEEVAAILARPDNIISGKVHSWPEGSDDVMQSFFVAKCKNGNLFNVAAEDGRQNLRRERARQFIKHVDLTGTMLMRPHVITETLHALLDFNGQTLMGHVCAHCISTLLEFVC